MSFLWKVRLFGTSSLRLQAARSFVLGSDKVRVSDDIGPPESGSKHLGFLYTVDIASGSPFEALAAAEYRAAQIADQLSLAHAAAIGDPQPAFGLANIGPSTVSLVQVVRNSPAVRDPRRAFDDAVFRPVFESLGRIGVEHPEKAARVRRAMRYFRRSTLATDPIDRFNDAWVGLEALNHAIQEKYRLPARYQPECADCGQPIVPSCGHAFTNVDGASGVWHILLNTLELPRKTAKAVRGKRIQIVHSTKDPIEILSGLDEATSIARKALLAGALDVLEVPPDIRPTVMRAALPLLGAPLFTAVARLEGTTVDQLAKNAKWPQIELMGVTAIVPNRPDDGTGPSAVNAISPHLTVRGFDGSWSIEEVRSRVERDPEDGGPAPQVLIREQR